MAFKDYYAILMVHPQAELLVIEAAYKRLAREYHPDRGHRASNHEKMVEINEAFAVLSNPARRRSYDQDYAQQLLGHQFSAAQAATKRREAQPSPPTSATKPANPLRTSVSPVQPNPDSFGIEVNYLSRAREGARAWQQREDRISSRVKQVTRVTSVMLGIITSGVFWWQSWRQLAAVIWLALPLLAELTMRLIESVRDAHLLRYKYNPLYNPNPSSYRQYAEACANYEAETRIVFVTRDALFHAQKTCQTMTSYDPMPKWFARLRNAQPCPRCASALTVAPKQLPSPFGSGKY